MCNWPQPMFIQDVKVCSNPSKYSAGANNCLIAAKANNEFVTLTGATISTISTFATYPVVTSTVNTGGQNTLLSSNGGEYTVNAPNSPALSGGAIAGIVIGSLAGLAILFALVLLATRNWREQKLRRDMTIAPATNAIDTEPPLASLPATSGNETKSGQVIVTQVEHDQEYAPMVDVTNQAPPPYGTQRLSQFSTAWQIYPVPSSNPISTVSAPAPGREIDSSPLQELNSTVYSELSSSERRELGSNSPNTARVSPLSGSRVAPPSSDRVSPANVSNVEAEQARVQRRKSQLQELMRLEEEEATIRKARLQELMRLDEEAEWLKSQNPPTELPAN
jgi:hypothetical protein